MRMLWCGLLLWLLVAACKAAPCADDTVVQALHARTGTAYWYVRAIRVALVESRPSEALVLAEAMCAEHVAIPMPERAIPVWLADDIQMGNAAGATALSVCTAIRNNDTSATAILLDVEYFLLRVYGDCDDHLAAHTLEGP